MSAFDVAMACTRNMAECLLQNHWETPPYGAIPDAEGKLRLAVNGMIDALIIAMAAESNGVTMPPLATPPPGEESEALMAGVRQEHTLHREYAESLRNLPEPVAEPVAEPEEGTRRHRRSEPENVILPASR